MTAWTRESLSASQRASFSSRWSSNERALSFSGRLRVIRARPASTSYRIVWNSFTTHLRSGRIVRAGGEKAMGRGGAWAPAHSLASSDPVPGRRFEPARRNPDSGVQYLSDRERGRVGTGPGHER